MRLDSSRSEWNPSTRSFSTRAAIKIAASIRVETRRWRRHDLPLEEQRTVSHDAASRTGRRSLRHEAADPRCARTLSHRAPSRCSQEPNSSRAAPRTIPSTRSAFDWMDPLRLVLTSRLHHPSESLSTKREELYFLVLYAPQLPTAARHNYDSLADTLELIGGEPLRQADGAKRALFKPGKRTTAGLTRSNIDDHAALVGISDDQAAAAHLASLAGRRRGSKRDDLAKRHPRFLGGS